MVRGSLYIFFQRRHTNGQKALEKILNITHHREMQIKTKMRCHFTPVRMTIIKMTKKKEILARMWREGNLRSLLVEM